MAIMVRKLFVAVAVLASVGRVDAAEKYALLIGINEYDRGFQGVPPLKYAREDVRELESALKAQGYTVHALVDDQARRRDILARLRRLATTVKPEDTFLLFFAGHGVREVNGKTYWLTFDAQLSFLDDAGIRLEHLLDYVQDIKAGRKLVLLDHCFSGDMVDAAPALAPAATALDATAPSASPRTGGGGRAALARGVVPADAIKGQIESRAQGMVVLAAARSSAYESEQLKHGVFTAAVLLALKTRKASGDDKLTTIELINFFETSEVKALFAEAGSSQQEVAQFLYGKDLASWELASSIPPDDSVEARTKLESYLGTLFRWEQHRWLTLAAKVKCRDVLQKWARTFEGGPGLTEIETTVLEETRKHLDASGVTEETCARDLQDVLQRLGVLESA